MCLLFACKSTSQEQEGKVQGQEEVTQETPQKGSEEPKESYSFLTAGKWYVQFTDVIRRPEARDTFKGQWFDFHKDYTYERGISDKKILTGSYDFDNDKKLLTFTPDNPKLEPISEWHVMTASDMMVLAGTSLYGNNHIQIKLEKVLPTSNGTEESE
jgi:hypothetical protein